MNVTKVEKNLNSLMSEYCSMLYLNNVISTVFFADFSSNHTIHFLLRKDIPEDSMFVKKGYYQVRIVVEVGQNYFKKAGYLEYYLEIEDIDKTTHIVQGTFPKDEDRRSKSDKPLDIKNFNYREAGQLFHKLESSFYQLFLGQIYKQRPSLNDETKLSADQRPLYQQNMNLIQTIKKEFEGKQNANQKTTGFYKSVGSMMMGAKTKSTLFS